MREGVLMNEQLLKMNGLSVKILDMLSYESHLGMGYEFTTENIQTYLNDVRRGSPNRPSYGRRHVPSPAPTPHSRGIRHRHASH